MAAATTGKSTPAAATRSPASSPAKETDADKLRFIEEVTTNADAEQERVLGEILARNADAEYLASKCGLAGATDRATFRAKVPMVRYEDLLPYIRCIADGDRSPILTGPAHPVTEFFTSSGTSGGERKLIPTIEDEFGRRSQLGGLVKPVINQYASGLDEGCGLYFHFAKSETTTPGGLPARTILTSMFKSDAFPKLPPGALTSPVAAILCPDAFQSMYAQVLCGLCQRRRVVRVGAVFASGLLRAIRFFQQNWEQLAADIEAGVLTDRVTDPSVRKAIAGVLRPDAELAQLIRAEGSGSIAPLEIRVVRSGTFEELADYAVSHGASMGQYKVPRCVTAPGAIQLLDSCVISRYFSPALPQWAPTGGKFAASSA